MRNDGIEPVTIKIGVAAARVAEKWCNQEAIRGSVSYISPFIWHRLDCQASRARPAVQQGHFAAGLNSSTGNIFTIITDFISAITFHPDGSVLKQHQ